MYLFTPKHVCSKSISFDLSDDLTVHNVVFVRGCSGNALGIAALVEGLPAQEVISRLRGICCDHRGTSCPDQLACALEEALAKELK